MRKKVDSIVMIVPKKVDPIVMIVQHCTIMNAMCTEVVSSRWNVIIDRQFVKIIYATPLISIDLVLEDSRGRVLLGKRINRPAQG